MYVLAHLKYIKYLDYRLVDQQAVGQAKEQYQDEVTACPPLLSLSLASVSGRGGGLPSLPSLPFPSLPFPSLS